MAVDLKTLCEYIPLYINGALKGKPRAQFEQALKQSAKLRQEYLEFSGIDALFDMLEDASDMHFEQLYKEIKNGIEAPPVKEQEPDHEEHYEQADSETDTSFRERFENFLHSIFTTPQLAWSITAVMFIMVTVFSLFNSLTSETPAFQAENTTAAVAAKPSNLNVVFADNATQKEIRKLLSRFQAQITAGPTENGMYAIFVNDPESTPKEIAERLQKSTLILLAEPAFL